MADQEGTDWLDLADAVAALRGQLAEAQLRGAYEPIKLSVEEVTIEFGLELGRSAKGDGGLRFGVVSIGAGGELSRRATHHVSLKLSVHTNEGLLVDISDEDGD